MQAKSFNQMNWEGKSKAVIITIGDELLIGQIVNTNAAWIGDQLSKMGLDVIRMIVIGDHREEIQSAVLDALEDAEVVVCTGGIGPTKDDITKEVLAEIFEEEMKFNQQAFDWIESHKAEQGQSTNNLHREQAVLPTGFKLYRNSKGTAPGMMYEQNGIFLIVVPGVPYEMKALLQYQIFEEIKEKVTGKIIRVHTLLTAGKPESEIASLLSDFEDGLPDWAKMAYLPGHTRVRLRLTVKGDEEAEAEGRLNNLIDQVKSILGPIVCGSNGDSLEEVVGKELKRRGLTLATAESCTGGYISHLITTVPGASDYFMGSIVSYSNSVKIKQLGVSQETLKRFGAVSEETVREMLKGICEKMNSDMGIAVSGIAGPGGGTEEKPVGTVWIAVGNSDSHRIEKLKLNQDRAMNIEKSGLLALNMLRLFLSGD